MEIDAALVGWMIRNVRLGEEQVGDQAKNQRLETNVIERRRLQQRRELSVPMKWEKRSPGEPSSMDILLTWLTTPGNYGRWRNEGKWGVTRDIAVAINAAGIFRTPSAVYHKIDAVERQYISATVWMRDMNIDRDEVSRGALERKTQEQLDKLCPHFFDLHPVFQEFFGASGETIGGSRKRGGASRSSEVTRASKRPHHLSAEVAAPHVEEELALSTGVVGSNEAVHHSATFAQEAQSVKSEWQFVDRVPETQLTPEFQQRQNECVLKHTEQRSQGILAAEENARECRLNTQRHQTEAERRKSEIDVVLTKVLARQTMKERGVSTDEIEMALPLHEP